MAGSCLGDLTFVNYFGAGVLTVLLFYLCRGRKLGWLWLLLGMLYINGDLIGGLMYDVSLLGHTISFYQQSFAVLAQIPIWLYNCSQGPHSRKLQLACYWFYPVHMMVLALIWLYILN